MWLSDCMLHACLYCILMGDNGGGKWLASAEGLPCSDLWDTPQMPLTLESGLTYFYFHNSVRKIQLALLKG